LSLVAEINGTALRGTNTKGAGSEDVLIFFDFFPLFNLPPNL
jgi:hypothetical protein